MPNYFYIRIRGIRSNQWTKLLRYLERPGYKIAGRWAFWIHQDKVRKDITWHSWFHRDARNRYIWNCWTQYYGPERSIHPSYTLCRSWCEEPRSKERRNLPSNTQKWLLCRLRFFCTTRFFPLSFSSNVELNTQHSSKSWIDNFPRRLDFPLLWWYWASELDGLVLASGFPTDCCWMALRRGTMTLA